MLRRKMTVSGLFSVLTAAGMAVTAGNASSPVWQLGGADGSSQEFISYNSGEFKTSDRIRNSPGYDAAKKLFTYRLPAAGIVERPEMPGGISGGHAGNNSLVSRQTLIWQEAEGGWRELELRILPGPRDYSAHRLHPNENMDIDNSDTVKAGLRLALPDGRVGYEYLPLDLATRIKTGGPLIVRVPFMAKPGENRIELAETSGHTYGRCYQFDYLRLTRLTADGAITPAVEYCPTNGFLLDQIYDYSHPAQMTVRFCNLLPNRKYQARVEFINYAGKTVKRMDFDLTASASGAVEKTVDCPAGETGHFRLRTSLAWDGKPVMLQMGQAQIETRLAAIRKIAPLSDEEISRSFIGLCGLNQSLYFDPAVYPRERTMEQYRAYRRLLQIHNERIHSLEWHFLERKKDQFDWGYWDALLEAEKRDRIQVQLCIIGTPEWLFRQYNPGKKTTHPAQIYFSVPPDMSRWANACGKIAARYRDRVSEFELWNEPSEQSLFWQQGTVKDYYELVKAGSEAIRRAAPEAKIVAETVWARQPDFITRLYQLGVGKYIDHPADHYTDPERLRMVNAMLAKYGANEGLVCNEAKCERSGPLGQIDEATRREAARNLLINYIYYNANGIKRVNNFVLVGTTWRMWGAIGPDDTPKYSFSALKTLNNRFTGAEFYRTYQLSEDVTAYLFKYYSPVRAKENGGDNIMLLVNRGDNSRKLCLFVNRPAVTLVDLMDNGHKLESPQGVADIELGADPVMLIGVDPMALDLVAKLKTEMDGSAKPGEALQLRIRLEDDLQLQGAELALLPDAGFTAAPPPFTLRSGEEKILRLPLDGKLHDGNYILTLKGRLNSKSGAIPVERSFAVTVARKTAGENMLSPLDRAGQGWRSWGGIKWDYLDGGGIKAQVSGTGAITGKQPLDVIGGQPYHAVIQVRGKGVLRMMLNAADAQGKEVAKNMNFMTVALTEEWKTVTGEWSAPAKAVRADIQFYQWQSDGWFELRQAGFVRLMSGVPLNRQLYTVKTPRRAGIVVDGNLADWSGAQWTPVAEWVGQGNDKDVPSAEFAAAWNDNVIYLAVKVKDHTHCALPGNELWQGDSLQVDFEPTKRRTAVPTAQFGFSGDPAGASIYRFTTISTEDIVETYKCGASPDGVTAVVTRKDGVTVYEAAIPGRAIWPTMMIRPGGETGFSLLLNDNDGKVRRGWLAWSGGIGGERNSTLFGKMIFSE